MLQGACRQHPARWINPYEHAIRIYQLVRSAVESVLREVLRTLGLFGHLPPQSEDRPTARIGAAPVLVVVLDVFFSLACVLA